MRDLLSRGMVAGLLGGFAYAALIAYLFMQPEPACPRGKHFVYPLEHCVGWAGDTGRVLP